MNNYKKHYSEKFIENWLMIQLIPITIIYIFMLMSLMKPISKLINFVLLCFIFIETILFSILAISIYIYKKGDKNG